MSNGLFNKSNVFLAHNVPHEQLELPCYEKMCINVDFILISLLPFTMFCLFKQIVHVPSELSWSFFIITLMGGR